MGDETIGAGTDIDMALGLGFVNPAGHNQVLPEVFAFGDAGFGVAVVELWVEGHWPRVGTPKTSIVVDESRDCGECTSESPRIDPKLRTQLM